MAVALLLFTCTAAALLAGSALASVLGGVDVVSQLERGATVLKTGTTIVGVCCRDGVVLGADTRATGGPLVIDKEKLKVHSLGPRMFCCAAGTSADCDQITRACSHALGLQRIEHELAGEEAQTVVLDSVSFAVGTIMELFQTPVGGRMPESAMILGGVDDRGPGLHHLTKDGAQRTTFCALGSGSVDAISVLESARKSWDKPVTVSFRDDFECLEQFVENVNVDEAVEAVRKAVQAGIINDLGSGSHVDICVIRKDGVRQWREKLKTAKSVELDELEQSAGTAPSPSAKLARPRQRRGSNLVTVKIIE